MATFTAAAGGRGATIAATADTDTGAAAATRHDLAPGSAGATPSGATPNGGTVTAGSGPGLDASNAAPGAVAADGGRAGIRGGVAPSTSGGADTRGGPTGAPAVSDSAGFVTPGSGATDPAQDGTAAATGRPIEGRGTVGTGVAGAGAADGVAGRTSAPPNGADVPTGGDTVQRGQGVRDPVATAPGEDENQVVASGPAARDDARGGGTMPAATAAHDGLHGRGVPSFGAAGASGDTVPAAGPATTGDAGALIPSGASSGTAAGPAAPSGTATTPTAATPGTDDGARAQAPSATGGATARDGTTAPVSAGAFGPSAHPLGFIAGATGGEGEQQAASGVSGEDLPSLDAPSFARAAGVAFDPAAGFTGADARPDQAAAADMYVLWADRLLSGGGAGGVSPDSSDRRSIVAPTPDTSVFPS